jgi:hypothetical protein
MTEEIASDLTLPLVPEHSRVAQGPVPAAAFVPIAIALIGVSLILVGGVSARSGFEPSVAVTPRAIDTLTTGSIASLDPAIDFSLSDR